MTAYQESRPRKKRFSSPVPFIILAILSIVLISAWWATSQNTQQFGVTVGRLNDFAPNSVTYVPANRLFIVQDEAQRNNPVHAGLTAFSDLEPVSRCRVQWQPDVESGVFLESCQGTRYGRDGKRISGPGAATLRQLPLRISRDVIIVLPLE